MDDTLLNLIYDLKFILKNQKCIIDLNKVEELMENNDEIKLLAYKLDMATIAYSDALKIYEKDEDKIKPFYDSIVKANDALNSHELVKEYNILYKAVKNISKDINEVLFKPFNEKIRL